MTLYYQIHETSTESVTYFEVKKVYNFLGLMFVFGECWVRGTSLFYTREYAEKLDTLKEAQDCAQDHANSVLKESKRKKAIKSKVVQTLVINEIKE